MALHNADRRNSKLENIKGFNVTCTPVRGFSNSVRVADNSVLLCISVRVEESPTDRQTDRHFCFLLFTSAYRRSQPYVRSEKLPSILLI